MHTQEELDTMSLDQLRALALQESEDASAQPRDEQGRFAKPQEDAQTATVDEDEPEEQVPARVIVRRVVDIGDGVDPEIFEAEGTDKADALEKLADKIADAKRNATKKIRQQEAELKKVREQEPKQRQFSEDEEYVYSQELMTKPSQAFSKMFKEMTGYDIGQFKTVADKMNAYEQGRARTEAVSQFITTHPDYVDDDRNRDVMQLAMQGKEVTAENLGKAYEFATTRGLLVLKTSEQSPVQEEEEQPKARIAPKVETQTPPQGTKKASGLSAKNRAPVLKSTEPSEDDLYNMPLEQLKQEALKRAGTR